MTTSLHRSSRYRFHDSARNDRKYLLVALTAALILMALLSALMFDFFPAAPK
ncbi:MAG: hypothetical protein H8K05_03645 [Nitrospira sp.]|nr:hypothetical protein [Nitrospira sp.]